MIVDKVLSAHQLALALDVYLVVWHPFSLHAWPRFHVFRPFRQLNWVDKLVFADSEEEEDNSSEADSDSDSSDLFEDAVEKLSISA